MPPPQSTPYTRNYMTTLLIDADHLIYEAAFASEEAVEWSEDQFCLWADLAKARDIFHEKIVSIREPLKEDHNILLAFSDSAKSFRIDFWPTYKSGRGRRPLLYRPLREWALDGAGYVTFLRPNLEADDILGILATHPKIVPGRKIIYSPDKDLLQIPGEHLIDGEIVTVSAREAELFALTQTLTGDQTDGYPGCPGIGAKRAPIIAEAGWPAIVAAYEKAGLTEDDALIQARCARLLTAETYDFATRTPILWSPET